MNIFDRLGRAFDGRGKHGKRLIRVASNPPSTDALMPLDGLPVVTIDPDRSAQAGELITSGGSGVDGRRAPYQQGATVLLKPGATYAPNIYAQIYTLAGSRWRMMPEPDGRQAGRMVTWQSPFGWVQDPSDGAVHLEIEGVHFTGSQTNQRSLFIALVKNPVSGSAPSTFSFRRGSVSGGSHSLQVASGDVAVVLEDLVLGPNGYSWGLEHPCYIDPIRRFVARRCTFTGPYEFAHAFKCYAELAVVDQCRITNTGGLAGPGMYPPADMGTSSDMLMRRCVIEKSGEVERNGALSIQGRGFFNTAYKIPPRPGNLLLDDVSFEDSSTIYTRVDEAGTKADKRPNEYLVFQDGYWLFKEQKFSGDVAPLTVWTGDVRRTAQQTPLQGPLLSWRGHSAFPVRPLSAVPGALWDKFRPYI